MPAEESFDFDSDADVAWVVDAWTWTLICCSQRVAGNAIGFPAHYARCSARVGAACKCNLYNI